MLVGGNNRMVWHYGAFPMPQASQAQIIDGLDQTPLHVDAGLRL
jgi:hypothetical protein